MNGLSAAEIAEGMGLPLDQTQEAIQILLDHGLVEMIDVDGEARYRATFQGVLADAILA